MILRFLVYISSEVYITPFRLCQYTSLYLVFLRFICCVPSCICVPTLIHTKIPQKEHFILHIRDFLLFLLFLFLFSVILCCFCVFLLIFLWFCFSIYVFFLQMYVHCFSKMHFFLFLLFSFCLFAVLPCNMTGIVLFFLFLHFTRVVILLIVP